MDTEILNIDYHVKQLVIKALNKYKKLKPTANALGISHRHVWRLKKIYDIEKNKNTNEFYFKPQRNYYHVK